MATIYLDFDGTIVEHAYPKLGRFVPHAMRVTKALQKAGHKIVLNTYRAIENAELFQQAKDYFQNFYPNDYTHAFKLDGVNDKKVVPPPWMPHIKSDILFIDDVASYMPLTKAMFDGGTMVDWLRVEEQLKKYKWI